jgi:selenocysteine lyase/cysteine desulfurase
MAVRSAYRHFQDQVDAQPDIFVRYEYRTHLLDQSRAVIAKYLSVPTDTCVFTPNTSTGVDTILRNLIYEPGDVLVYLATGYESFKYTMQYLTETTPVEMCRVEYILPTYHDDICVALENAITNLQQAKKKPKLVLFDTISSIPGVRLPFERLTELCKQHKILSCIDGAHGVGHLPLELTTLDPDFFISNCHKWLHVPRSCALLYVPIRNQHLLRATLPTGFAFMPQNGPASSDSSGKDNFVANFASVGTLDDSPYLCVEAAIAWRRRLAWDDLSGEKAIMNYCRRLARDGGEAVATVLGTEVLDNDHS